jgi:hypothetical protein
MNIEKLQGSDSRYSVPAVHPRLAVIKASPDQRADLVATARSSEAVILDRADACAALASDRRRREVAHTLAVEAQSARLAAATTELVRAVDREDEAIGNRAALTGAIADFDVLAAEAIQTDGRRDEAWAARRRALALLVDAADQLERVQVQRRGAASDLNEAQSHFRDGPKPGQPDGFAADALAELHAHVSAVHEALDKADTHQQAAARDAERQLVAAIAGVADADAAMEVIWSRLGETVADEVLGRWGHGHPEAGMIAEHREALVVLGATFEGDRIRAALAVVAATLNRDGEARRLVELDGPDAEPARVAHAMRAWLKAVVDDQAAGAPKALPLVLDDTFAEIDPTARHDLMDALVTESARTQLLYLTDQVDVLAWAIGLPDDIGGLDHVATADRPVFALTD